MAVSLERAHRYLASRRYREISSSVPPISPSPRSLSSPSEVLKENRLTITLPIPALPLLPDHRSPFLSLLLTPPPPPVFVCNASHVNFNQFVFPVVMILYVGRIVWSRVKPHEGPVTFEKDLGAAGGEEEEEEKKRRCWCAQVCGCVL